MRRLWNWLLLYVWYGGGLTIAQACYVIASKYGSESNKKGDSRVLYVYEAKWGRITVQKHRLRVSQLVMVEVPLEVNGNFEPVFQCDTGAGEGTHLFKPGAWISELIKEAEPLYIELDESVKDYENDKFYPGFWDHRK